MLRDVGLRPVRTDFRCAAHVGLSDLERAADPCAGAANSGACRRALRGGGAHLDNRRIRVSKQRGLEGALIGTGFPYRANAKYMDSYMAMLRAVMENTAGVRRPGSAALDLAYVAAGRTDAFWEIGLGPWDTAAGTLLVQEAGGHIGTLTGREYTQGGNVLAGSPKVYAAMLELLAPHVPCPVPRPVSLWLASVFAGKKRYR